MARRMWAIGISLVLALQCWAGAASASAERNGESAATPDSEQIGQAIEAAAKVIAESEVISDWGAFGLARAGKPVPAAYMSGVEKLLKEKDGTFAKVTDYERMAIAVKAAGGDPLHVAGYNLIEKIYNSSRMTHQGTNGPIFALIALNGGSYAIPADAKWNPDKLREWLLARQNADGGWPLAEGDESNVDVTAMALTSLSPYKEQLEVKPAIDKAVSWLSKAQLDNGGFSQNGENCESIAQVIIALTSLGIDPAGASFTKADGNPLSRLLAYRQPDGGFAHTIGLRSDGMATEQALQALVAYRMFISGQGPLFPTVKNKVQVTVRVEGPKGPVAEGAVRADTALEAVEQALTDNKVPYHVKSASFGKYIETIDGVTMGSLGGFDGWMFSVERGGGWLFPQIGMADFRLREGDRIIVYYGDGTTQMIRSIRLIPERPKAGEPFTVKVEQVKWDYEKNAESVTPASGVVVRIGTMTAETDERGIAAFDSAPADGKLTVTVTGYREGKTPAVVRESKTFVFGSPSRFADENEISGWARSYVQKASEYRLMEGVSVSEPRFAPKRPMTRAEFTVLLVKLLGESPVRTEKAVFSDVPSGTWYAGYVAKAKQLGVVSGVTPQSFAPNRPVLREEMAIMLARAFHLSTEINGDARIADIGRASRQAVPYITAVYAGGIMLGSGGYFEPRSPVTREMAAVIAVKAYEMKSR